MIIITLSELYIQRLQKKDITQMDIAYLSVWAIHTNTTKIHIAQKDREDYNNSVWAIHAT